MKISLLLLVTLLVFGEASAFDIRDFVTNIKVSAMLRFYLLELSG